MKKLMIGFAVLSAAVTANAAGFGLYEMSAKATAMGGQVFAKPVDASANYYNPATLSSLTGTWVTVGFTTLHPTYDYAVNGVNYGKMDPGVFLAPNAFVSQELPFGFTAGIGFYADYGIGSKYNNYWPLSADSTETTFESYSVNPNIAYKITDKWSVAAGVRLVHATFEQKRGGIFMQDLSQLSAFGVPSALVADRFHLRVKNDIDVGYVLGTQYQLFDNFAIGATWRSRVRTRFEGKTTASGNNINLPNHPLLGDLAGARLSPGAMLGGDVSEKVDLPSSATVGFNWDIIDDLHMGASITWTEWSTMDELMFSMPAKTEVMELGWHNAYRTGLGFAYDVTDWCSAMIGYVYDWDPQKTIRAGTMLPAGDRHIISFGPSFAWGNWEFSASYAIVIMESKTQNIHGAKFQTDNSFTHVCSAAVTYHF